ncbi:MAG: YhbY family RNA-binding protein [Zoogloeaceae bacterium]|nr:YhbY family RNA-binding protein [Zoogloeaceae bacterium]
MSLPSEPSAEKRRALRASAHHLRPVVAISHAGLSDAVVKEVDRALSAHELIKVRVFHDERATREQYLATLCATLRAFPVQHIGKLLILWRPRPEERSRKGGRDKPAAKTSPSAGRGVAARNAAVRNNPRRKPHTGLPKLARSNSPSARKLWSR